MLATDAFIHMGQHNFYNSKKRKGFHQRNPTRGNLWIYNDLTVYNFISHWVYENKITIGWKAIICKALEYL